jgi:hypothetical protein
MEHFDVFPISGVIQSSICQYPIDIEDQAADPLDAFTQINRTVGWER